MAIKNIVTCDSPLCTSTAIRDELDDRRAPHGWQRITIDERAMLNVNVGVEIGGVMTATLYLCPEHHCFTGEAHAQMTARGIDVGPSRFG